MKYLLIILLSYFGAVIFSAEGETTTLIQILENVTKRTNPHQYPILPVLSTAMSAEVTTEMSKNETIKGAMLKLDSAKWNSGWRNEIKILENERATGSLQACLLHQNSDVQIMALRALGNIGRYECVPFVLLYADYIAVFRGGSEAAAIHGIIHEDIAAALGKITGISVNIDGQDPDKLRGAIRLWSQWYLDKTTPAMNVESPK